MIPLTNLIRLAVFAMAWLQFYNHFSLSSRDSSSGNVYVDINKSVSNWFVVCYFIAFELPA